MFYPWGFPFTVTKLHICVPGVAAARAAKCKLTRYAQALLVAVPNALIFPVWGLSLGRYAVGDGATGIPEPRTLLGTGLDPSPSNTDGRYGTGMGLAHP
jgi:hypothetical protein